ncbi:MAG: hypothetical protein ABL308_00300 [Oceanicaulis sp.]
MARMREENSSSGKALGEAAKGGALGLGAALVAAAACAVAFSQEADGQQPIERPSLAAALAECESGAFEGASDGRALGACDIAMRAPELDDAMRAKVLVNRGLIALDRGILRQARADLEQAVQLDPDLAEAWLNLSAARTRSGASSDAVAAARRAREAGADAAMAHFNEAVALEAMGRYDAAYEAYVAAADAAPDNATFQAQPRRFRRHQAG